MDDSFRMLAHEKCIANRKKEALIRPAIPANYRKVCNLDLFGDSLDSKIEEIDKEDKRIKKFIPDSFLFYKTP